MNQILTQTQSCKVRIVPSSLATEKNLVAENLVFHTHTGPQKVEALNQILHNSLMEEDLCNEDHRIRFWDLKWWVTFSEGEMKPHHHC
jgi:hypothetical protein